MYKEHEEVTIKEGYGYWDITYYPYGGDFRRAVENLKVIVEKDLGERYGVEVSFISIEKDSSIKKSRKAVVHYDALQETPKKEIIKENKMDSIGYIINTYLWFVFYGIIWFVLYGWLFIIHR